MGDSCSNSAENLEEFTCVLPLVEHCLRWQFHDPLYLIRPLVYVFSNVTNLLTREVVCYFDK